MPQPISPIHESAEPEKPPALAAFRPSGTLPGAGALSDDEVVRRVLAGDAASFELIMRRYNQRLFRIARGILGDDSAAEDAVQEAYLHAFEHLAQFEGRASFATWLTRIAVYAALAFRREWNRMTPLDPHAADARDAAERQPRSHARPADEVAGNRELGGVLAEAIDRLPADLRVVFMLRVVEALDTRETAECLELSESNVKVRLHRARAQLQRAIDDRIGVEARRLYQFDGDRCDRLVAAVMRRLRPSADRG